MQSTRSRRLWPLFLLFFIGAVVFNLKKLPYGYFSIDESLYLAVPYRMLQGDCFLLQEWHMSQMSYFLLLPLMRLYLLLSPTTDGIALTFRAIYVFFHTLTALFLYWRLRRQDEIAASATAVLYEISSYASLMALSYNTMGIGLMLLCCVTMADPAADSRRGASFFAGLCFAGAVLCCPYLLLLYLVYSTAVLISVLREKRTGRPIPGLSGGRWLLFTLACALLAALFFGRIFLLFGMRSAALLRQVLPMIVVDEEHPAQTIVGMVYSFYTAFYRFNTFFKPVLYGSVVLGALILLDRKRKKRRALYLTAALGLTLLFAVPYLLTYRAPNYILFCFHIPGFFSWLLCEKKYRRMMAFVWLPGAAYWFFINAASNMSLSTICGISAVNLPASVLFITQLLREMLSGSGERTPFSRAADRFGAGLTIGLCALLAVMLAESRIENSFTTTPFRELTETSPVGTTRGLRVSEEERDVYAREYAALAPLRAIPKGNVLYFSADSRHYLADPKRCASCTMWLIPRDPSATLDRLELYWSLFPDKFPDYVYLTDEQLADRAVMNAFDRFVYTLTPLESGAVLCPERP